MKFLALYLILDEALQKLSSFATLSKPWRIVYEKSRMTGGMESNQKDGRTVTKLVDKMIRLKLILVKGHSKKYPEERLCKWFETRI